MKKQILELDFNSMTTVDFYPYEVVVKIMEALELAERKSDLAALKWCAKKILWLYEISDTSTGSMSEKSAGKLKLFMSAFMGHDMLPLPASIAGIVEAIGEAE